MKEPAPQRPPMLVAALVVLPLAAFVFAMAETAAGEPTKLSSLALPCSLLAIRFNWARVTSLVTLAVLTVSWLPGALKHANDEVEVLGRVASYVFVGTALFAAGAVLACLPESAQYYRQAAQWRMRRKNTL